MNLQIGAYLYESQATMNYTRRSQIGAPAWVFIDEHEDTIHDGRFWFEGPFSLPPSSYRWLNVPAARHTGRGVLSFSDGHVEQHKWVDSRTLIPVLHVRQGGISAPKSADIAWLIQQCPP